MVSSNIIISEVVYLSDRAMVLKTIGTSEPITDTYVYQTTQGNIFHLFAVWPYTYRKPTTFLRYPEWNVPVWQIKYVVYILMTTMSYNTTMSAECTKETRCYAFLCVVHIT